MATHEPTRPDRVVGPPRPRGGGGPAALWLRLPARLRRCARLELAGWLGSLLAGAVAWTLLGRVDALALAAVAGEWVGFYGAAWLLERRTLRRRQGRAAPRSAARALLAEFALAEALDALMVRPLAIALATTLVPPPFLAVVLGGALADVVFYAVAAIGRRCARGTTVATASDNRCALDLTR